MSQPDNLYRDGLNRQLFLPFVDLLKTHVDVINLDARTDYRLEKLNRLPVYLSPLNEETDRLMNEAWHAATGGATVAQDSVKVKGHTVIIPQAAPHRRQPALLLPIFARSRSGRQIIPRSSSATGPSSSMPCRCWIIRDAMKPSDSSS